MKDQLEQYQVAFGNLRPNRTNGRSSPHKASMLLAVIDLIEQGVIDQSIIHFDQRLKDAFTERFDSFRTAKDKDDPSQPFFYLSSSPFWQLHPNEGCEMDLQRGLKERRHGSESKVRRLISHASIDRELFQLLQNDVVRAQLAMILESSLQSAHDRFRAWAASLGKSPKTISNYLTALTGSINTWAYDGELIVQDIMTLETGHDVHQLLDKLNKLDIFKARDRKGNGMYSAALRMFQRFLESDSGELLAADLSAIQQSTELDTTEKAVLVNARKGQGLYRERILAQWHYCCSVTQYTNTRLLVASHIRPWRDSNNQQRLDRFNGLLLIPNLDRAFDLGLISFKSDGQILLANSLETPDSLGIHEDMRIQLKPQNQPYLEYHRDEIFN